MSNVHTNSVKSYRQTDFQTITDAIRRTYKKSKDPLTDRQVMRLLGYSDMNLVRPKITRLIELGKCAEVGTVTDMETKRDVRLVTITGRQEAVSKPVTIPRALLLRLHRRVVRYAKVNRRQLLIDATWNKVQNTLRAIEDAT